MADAPVAPSPATAAPVIPAATAPVTSPAPGGAAPPPASAAEPVSADVERRAAALAKTKREQQKLRKDAEAFKAQQAAFQSQQRETLAKAAQLDEYTQLLQRDPLQFLERTGLTIDQLIERKMGIKKSPQDLTTEAVDKRLAEIDAKRQQTEKAALNTRALQIQAGMKQELRRAMSSDKDRYELVNAIGDPSQHVERAYKLMEDYYEANWDEASQTSKQLSYDKALDAIEYDLEQAQDRVLDSKKVKAKLDKRLAEQQAKATATPVPAPGDTKTRSTAAPSHVVTPSAPSEGNKMVPKALTPRQHHQLIRDVLRSSKLASDS